MTVNELITDTLLPTIQALIKKIENSDKVIKELEEKQKRLEREIKYYWRIMTLLLLIQLVVQLF